MRIRTMISTLMAAVLLGTGAYSSSAQLPTSIDTQAQAAAITLTSEDLPTGFALTGETFLPLPSGDELPGAQAHYVSLYTNIESGQQIRSYVYIFESDDQATAGFELLEGSEAETLTDAEVEVGSGASEISTGTYVTADGATIGTADVTFVRGNAITGVAVDNPDGSQPDAKLATDLAARADARVQQVQGDDAAVDLALPAKVLPLGTNGTVIQSGYVSSAESEAIYGTQGSALTGLRSSYVQTVGFGENGVTPRVTIGVTTFGSADDAKAVVEQADRIFQPLADQQQVEGVEIDGSDAVVAYYYTSRDGTTAERESYRVIYAQGETVTVVDVQGAPDTATAEAAANTIATSQLTCQSGDACEVPAAPGVLPAN